MGVGGVQAANVSTSPRANGSFTLCNALVITCRVAKTTNGSDNREQPLLLRCGDVERASWWVEVPAFQLCPVLNGSVLALRERPRIGHMKKRYKNVDLPPVPPSLFHVNHHQSHLY